MRSIPLALAWEFWRRARVGLLASLVGLTALAALLTALLYDKNEGSLSLHYVLLWGEMVLFGTMVVAATTDGKPGRFGFPPRLYVAPLATPRLVGWPMLFGVASVMAMHWIFVGAVRLLFGFHWPALGPALVLGAAVAWVQVVIWSLARHAMLQMLASYLAVGLFAVWLSARYNAGLVGLAGGMWQLTVGEALFLGSCIAAAYGAAVWGVARDRRGDALPRFEIRSWLQRPASVLPREVRAFSSASAAQFWFEWGQKGIFFPVAIAFAMAFLILWDQFLSHHFGSWRAEEGLGVLAGVGLMGLPFCAGLFGFAVGLGGANSQSLEIGVFRASRPLGDNELSSAILKVGAASVLAAWAVCVCAMAVETVLLAFQGEAWTAWAALLADAPFPMVWLVVPLGSLALACALMALGASLSLTGRLRFMGAVIGGFYVSIFAFFVFRAFADRLGVRPGIVEAIPNGAAFVFGPACLIGTVCAYVAARRQGHISRRLFWMALALWLLLAAGAGSAWGSVELRPAVWLVLAPGLVALPFAPLAAAPLAVAWNRHR